MPTSQPPDVPAIGPHGVRPCLRHRPWWLAACLLVGATACPAAPGAEETASRQAEAELLAAIDAEVGQAACTADAQCRSLAIGARACGGPERWMAWSVTTSRGERLDLLAGKLSALVQARHARSGLMSTCVVIPDPGALCQSGRCALGSSHRGSTIR
ncbi:MAG TPA: hypothetical protein PK306_18935 [Aquabacterium sp.]|nr:hypothetical protein [Aquabacterium sp.]